MCGITCTIVKSSENKYWDLFRVSEIRGQDGSGYVYYKALGQTYTMNKVPYKASLLMKYPEVLHKGDVVIGQNRLACFGLDISNQQPLMSRDSILVHNGNLYDFEELFTKEQVDRRLEVDTELILRLWDKYKSLDVLYHKLQGNFACILVDRNRKEIQAFTRDKPLCWYEDDTGIYLFSTRRIGEKVFGKEAKINELENFSRIKFNY